MHEFGSLELLKPWTQKRELYSIHTKHTYVQACPIRCLLQINNMSLSRNCTYWVKLPRPWILKYAPVLTDPGSEILHVKTQALDILYSPVEGLLRCSKERSQKANDSTLQNQLKKQTTFYLNPFRGQRS